MTTANRFEFALSLISIHHDAAVGLYRDCCFAFLLLQSGYGNAGDDALLVGLVVELLGDTVGREVEGEREWFLLGVKTCDVPLRAVAAGQDDIAAGVAVDVASLVPCGRNLLEEVKRHLRQFVEVVGLHGDTLHGGLVGEGRCNLEGIGGIALVAALVVLRHKLIHDDAAPVHRGHCVSAEGVHGEVERLTTGCSLVEIVVLAGQHGLAGYVVGIHAFPATG